MSRDGGFAIADTDTAMLSDPKVVALARLLRDPVRTAAAVTLYEAVRLASWRAGCRLTLAEAVPGWWLDPWDDLAAALVASTLLDAEQRIPEHAWRGWFEPAWQRREAYRELGRRGGLARALAVPASKRTPERTVSVRQSVRSSPSVPTVPTVPGARARAREEDAATPDGESDEAPPTAPDDPVLEALTLAGGRVPGRRAIAWADELAGEHGPAAVADAIGWAASRDPTGAKLLSLAADRLRETSVRRERAAERAEERRREQRAAEAREQRRAEAVRRSGLPQDPRSLREIMAGLGLPVAASGAQGEGG